MFYTLTADAIVVLHLAFVVFVVLGGLLVFRWPRVSILHLPAVVWGVLLELYGWRCPLTPWEQQLRQLANSPGYSGGFIENYLLPVLYPAALTPPTQLMLATFVIVVNLLVYGWLLRRRMLRPRRR